MKLSIVLVVASIALTGSLALAFAQTGSAQSSNLVSMSAWSRPSLVATYGIQMRERVDFSSILTHGGPSVVVRFEPIPQSTVQSMQQMAASQQHVLAYTPRKISAATVSIDVVNDSAPARCFKAKVTADPLVFEVALPTPIGGWYNQPLRMEAHVFSDDQEIFSSDSIVTLSP
jgi:hypothetical protein